MDWDTSQTAKNRAVSSSQFEPSPRGEEVRANDFGRGVVSMLLTGLPEFPYSAYILPAVLNSNCSVSLPFGVTAKRTVV